MKIYSDDPNLPYKTTKLKALYTKSEIDGIFAKWGVLEQLMNNKNNCKTNSRLSKPKKVLLFTAGSISLVLGVLGMVLPILPTTPFLLLSIACYCRSKERMYQWMLNNKLFGKYISNYRTGRGIPLKTKIFAIAMLWLLIGYSVFFVIGILFVQIILLGIAVGVTIHLIRLPTFKGKQTGAITETINTFQ